MQKKAKYGMNLSIAHLLYINTSKDISLKDYYPGGMVMPERSFSYENYGFGFNGKLKDDDVKGSGNSYDFGERIYDPRLSKWLSVDPLQKKYPSISPYIFAMDNPVVFFDPDGREVHGFEELRQNGFKLALSIFDKASVFMNYMQKFASLNNGDQFGATSNGMYSSVQIQFGIYSSNDEKSQLEYGSTSIEVSVGGQWIALSRYTGEGSKIDATNGIRVAVKLDPKANAEDRILTISHESVLHLESQANLVKQLQDGAIDFATFQRQYAELVTTQDETSHQSIVNHSNSLYEKVNDNIESVMATNKELNPDVSTHSTAPVLDRNGDPVQEHGIVKMETVMNKLLNQFRIARQEERNQYDKSKQKKL